MTIQITDWWLTIRINEVCWADFQIGSVILISIAYVIGRRIWDWWRWRGADQAEYYLTEDGWDKL